MRRELRAHLADAVAERDHLVESLGDELVDVLGAVPLMSMPRVRSTRTALGWSGFGSLPALRASIAPADMCSINASAIWDRALFPVHRNNTRCEGAILARLAGQGWCYAMKRRMESTARCLQRPSAGTQVNRVVAVATVR